jgi:hypothetical protein
MNTQHFADNATKYFKYTPQKKTLQIQMTNLMKCLASYERSQKKNKENFAMGNKYQKKINFLHL